MAAAASRAGWRELVTRNRGLRLTADEYLVVAEAALPHVGRGQVAVEDANPAGAARAVRLALRGHRADPAHDEARPRPAQVPHHLALDLRRGDHARLHHVVARGVRAVDEH